MIQVKIIVPLSEFNPDTSEFVGVTAGISDKAEAILQVYDPNGQAEQQLNINTSNMPYAIIIDTFDTATLDTIPNATKSSIRNRLDQFIAQNTEGTGNGTDTSTEINEGEGGLIDLGGDGYGLGLDIFKLPSYWAAVGAFSAYKSFNSQNKFSQAGFGAFAAFAALQYNKTKSQ